MSNCREGLQDVAQADMPMQFFITNDDQSASREFVDMGKVELPVCLRVDVGGRMQST